MQPLPVVGVQMENPMTIEQVRKEREKIYQRYAQLDKWCKLNDNKLQELRKNCPHTNEYYEPDPAGGRGDMNCPDCDRTR